MNINVYIGYDRRQDESKGYPDLVNPPYSVAKASILKHYKGPADQLTIQPIKLNDVIEADLYNRIEDPLASTEFTYSRFLTPYLNNYKGIAVFCDSDFLWQCDIRELLEFYNKKYSIMCVQHEHVPPESTKMDGCKQTQYPRKNWSSMMMFNCAHPDCANLSVKNINLKEAKYLHRMGWTADINIGHIPPTYNWLEGWYNGNIDPKVIHYTRGGPWHETWEGDYGENWIGAYYDLVASSKAVKNFGGEGPF